MAQAVPLVRAIALLPTLRWLGRHGMPVETMLRRHQLDLAPELPPTRPVPLLKVADLLRDVAREAGPDVPCRIVEESADIDLVQVGRVALGSRTPAEALARIATAIPYFCSHELLSIDATQDSLVVHHAYGAPFDRESLHLMSQYALAVLDRICAMTGAPRPRFLRADLPAHPDFGVAHLEPWFDANRVTGNNTKSLSVTLDRGVAQRSFPRRSRDRTEQFARMGLQPLRGDGGFSQSVRILLAAILEDEETAPSLGRAAEAAGMSTRTFQRRLREENQGFKQLLDEVRQHRAVSLVTAGHEPIGRVARRLGYARPTSLNRSMMRWTSNTPTGFRKETV